MGKGAISKIRALAKTAARGRMAKGFAKARFAAKAKALGQARHCKAFRPHNDGHVAKA
jgi:hypothetical protein